MYEVIVCTEAAQPEQVLRDHRRRHPDTGTVTTLCTTGQQLVAALARAERRQTEVREPFLTVKTADGPRICPLSDIMFCQSDAHRFHVYLADGTVLVSTNGRCRFFESVAPLLEDRRFLSCGRSILINTDYIALVNRTQVLLYGGRALPMPVHRQAEFRAELAQYRAHE
ncbi:MAG: LytTR family transcriptional regulator DNA-binding domain-containing protein [Pseudoflavonifractor sp.]